GEKFKEVKNAFDFLNDKEKTNVESFDENIEYPELIRIVVKYFSPNKNWDNLFLDTSITGISKDCSRLSIEIFRKLSKDRAIQVYDFLSTFSLVDKEILELYKSILQEKCSIDNVILLNPDLDDLFNDNIYKLLFQEKEYYIPLWHHELHFSLQNKDLIIKCEPDIPNNCWIDDRNNIYFLSKININELFEQGYYDITICKNKTIKIMSNELSITNEKQVIIKRNEGILKINDTHTYDTTLRGDIYLECILENNKST
ncbi:MAG: hypothetical protein QNL35_02630, partial [Emcibacteraceae bacterium]